MTPNLEKMLSAWEVTYSSRDKTEILYPDGSFVSERVLLLIEIIRKQHEALNKIQNNSVPGGHDQNMARTCIKEIEEMVSDDE